MSAPATAASVKRTTDAILTASFFMCIALGQAPSRRNINGVIVRQTGKGMRPSTIAEWLRKRTGNHLGTDLYPSQEPPFMLETQQLGTTSGTNTEPATLRDVIGNCIEASASMPEVSKKPKQGRLALRTPQPPINARAGSVLDAIWIAVKPYMDGKMTRATWKSRNIRPVKDMLAAGSSEERILACQAALSEEYGEPIWSMQRVQTRLLTGEPRRNDGLNENGFLPSPSDDIPLLCDLVAAGLA